MPTIRFTDNLQRHVPCPTREVPGDTVLQALDHYFRENERVRGYVLDEQGRLRRHMSVFVDGRQLEDRRGLSDPVSPGTIIDIIQALSGG